jgi:hypothetical protein
MRCMCEIIGNPVLNMLFAPVIFLLFTEEIVLIREFPQRSID